MAEQKKLDFVTIFSGRDGSHCEKVYEGQGRYEDWETIIKDRTGLKPNCDGYIINFIRLEGDCLEIGSRTATKTLVEKRGRITGEHKYNLQRIDGGHFYLGDESCSFLEQVIDSVRKSEQEGR